MWPGQLELSFLFRLLFLFLCLPPQSPAPGQASNVFFSFSIALKLADAFRDLNSLHLPHPFKFQMATPPPLPPLAPFPPLTQGPVLLKSNCVLSDFNSLSLSFLGVPTSSPPQFLNPLSPFFHSFLPLTPFFVSFFSSLWVGFHLLGPRRPVCCSSFSLISFRIAFPPRHSPTICDPTTGVLPCIRTCGLS